jgi:hypothetical protein
MNPRYALAAISLAAAVAATLLVASLTDRSAHADSRPKQVAYLGATLADLSPDACRAAGVKAGVLVVAVETDGPADKGGLREGDIITEFEHREVTRAYQLYGKVRQMRPGELTAVRFWRDGTDHIELFDLGTIDFGTPVTNGIVDTELGDRIDRLEREVASLHRRVDKLEGARQEQ